MRRLIQMPNLLIELTIIGIWFSACKIRMFKRKRDVYTRPYSRLHERIVVITLRFIRSQTYIFFFHTCVYFKQMIDHHSYVLNLSSWENKAWKKFRCSALTNWANKPMCYCIMFAMQQFQRLGFVFYVKPDSRKKISFASGFLFIVAWKYWFP